jgi:hypothetical protein
MSRQAFTTCSTLAVDCVLYQELSLTNLWGAGVYYDGGTCWVVNSSGQITGTTTCEVGYDFYYADDYYCAEPCGLTAYNQIVAFPAGSSPTINKYYWWSGGTDTYLITGAAYDPGFAVPLLLDTNGPWDNCTQGCLNGGG